MSDKQSTETVSQPLGVYQAITKVTGMMAKKGISKDRKNTQQGYSFRGIDDVYNVLGGMLAECNLCIIPRVLTRSFTEKQTKAGSPLFYVVVEVEYDIVSSLDGSKHVARSIGEAMDSADKATNKAMSAAYKYMAFQTFAIPTEGDNDADAVTHAPRPATARQATPQQSADGIARAKTILASNKTQSDGDLSGAFTDHPAPMSGETKSAVIAAFAEIGFTEDMLVEEYGKQSILWSELDTDELRKVLIAKRIEAEHAKQGSNAVI